MAGAAGTGAANAIRPSRQARSYFDVDRNLRSRPRRSFAAFLRAFTDNFYEADVPPVIIEQPHHQPARPENCAILLHVPALVECDVFRCRVGHFYFGHVDLYIFGREDKTGVLALYILTTIAEELLRTFVPGANSILKISGENGVTRGTLDHPARSEEHTSELQSPCNLVCRL